MRRIPMGLIFLLLPLTLGFAQRHRTERLNEHFQASADRPLEVRLDVDAAEVVVESVDSPDAIEVIIRMPGDHFRQRVDFNASRNRLSVDLKKNSWWKKKGYDDRNHVRIRVQLPKGVDILLDSKIRAGEAAFNLTGLRLKELYFQNWAGEVEIDFDAPNPIIMEALDIHTRVGEMTLNSLGNARFKRADINGGIGEIDIDFTGDLLDDSRAKVDLDIGEARIVVPQQFGVRMEIGGGFSFMSEKNIDSSFYKRGHVYYTEDFDDWDRRFALRVTPGLGELTVDVD